MSTVKILWRSAVQKLGRRLGPRILRIILDTFWNIRFDSCMDNHTTQNNRTTTTAASLKIDLRIMQRLLIRSRLRQGRCPNICALHGAPAPTIPRHFLRLRMSPLSSTSHTNGDGYGDSNKKRRDAFRIFSLPYKFQIDEDALRATYRSIMKDLHPDMQHQNRSDSVENQHEDVAVQGVTEAMDPSVVTDAYYMLRRPHIRATHLLEILGYPLKEEANEVHEDFLMEIMELRHEIEAADTDVELRPLFDANLQRIAETCQLLHTAFETHNVDTAWKLAGELQYWNRIDETLREKMESLDA
jgi:Fe-S protein assembly co-chaperone HscB